MASKFVRHLWTNVVAYVARAWLSTSLLAPRQQRPAVGKSRLAVRDLQQVPA